jgi:hypothetical protein
MRDDAGIHLEDNPLVAFPPRHSFPVKVLEQRNCVLPAQSRDFLKERDIDAVTLGFAPHQQFLQLL